MAPRPRTLTITTSLSRCWTPHRAGEKCVALRWTRTPENVSPSANTIFSAKQSLVRYMAHVLMLRQIANVLNHPVMIIHLCYFLLDIIDIKYKCTCMENIEGACEIDVWHAMLFFNSMNYFHFIWRGETNKPGVKWRDEKHEWSKQGKSFLLALTESILNAGARLFVYTGLHYGPGCQDGRKDISYNPCIIETIGV